MIWDGGLVTLLAQNNFDEEYSTKTIFTVSMYSWYRETVMRRGLCTMCDQSLSALCLCNRWQVTGMLSLAGHWQGRQALSNHVCAHSLISMSHMICLQHLARACSEQYIGQLLFCLSITWSRCPHCLSGSVNHDYRQVSNIRRTLVGNKIVDHSDVVGAPPVGAAPTTSSFST